MPTMRIDAVMQYAEVDRILRSVASAFAGTTALDSDTVRIAEVEMLPELPALEPIRGLSFEDCPVSGGINKETPSQAVRASGIATSVSMVGSCGAFELLWDVCAEGASLGSDKCDTVSISHKQGRWYFTFLATHSLASQDVGYRLEFISGLIHAASLPLTIVQRKKRFYLTHSSGKELLIFLYDGSDYANPHAFSVEIGQSDYETMLSRLESALTSLSLSTLGVRWKAMPFSSAGRFLPNPSGQKVYDLVRSLQTPTSDCYKVGLRYKLLALEGLEGLRSIPIVGGQVVNTLAVITATQKRKVTVESRTSPEGHFLYAKFDKSSVLLMTEIEAVVGRKFSVI